MASNFSSLRSSRKNLLSKLAEEAKKETQKGGGADERFWKLSVDQKTKIGYAVIRFLPAPKDEELPWVRLFSHGFKGPGGKWFIENCPTTLGQRPCPICKENNRLWNLSEEKDTPEKKIARDRKRKLQFISNILVVSDPAKPENNGKVFLFKYGAKIYDKIKEQIEPEFPDKQPINPFDLWEGANFKLKSRDLAGYQNYDKSEFDTPSEVLDGDEEKLEKLWESQYSLQEHVAEKQFKSYDDLEKHFNNVLNGTTDAPKTAEDAIKRELAAPTTEDAAEVAEEVAKQEVKQERKSPAKRPAPKVKEEKPAPAVSDEDEDIKSFFSSLDED